MQRVKLSGTDLNVSRICIGCWQMNNNQAHTWEAQTLEASNRIIVLITLVHKAGYAGSEEVLGKCLEGRRRDAIIATKFGFRDGITTPPYSAAQIDEAVTKSLQKLQTDYIDLLQTHFPSFIANMDEALEELKRQQARGRIRHFGVCNFGPKNLKDVMAKGVVPVSCQLGYSLLWRSAEYEVIPICRENNINILAYSPLQQGLLSGKYSKLEDLPEGRRRGKLFSAESTKLSRHGQTGAEAEMFEFLQKMRDVCAKADVPMSKAAISWIMQKEPTSVAIVGCRTPEQVVENSKIIRIPDSMVEQLTEASEPIKAKIGKQLDQWSSPDRCE
ncbi:hypothetical protein ACJMK2_024071 [Sinanodonta woodiana]|uniref:NADP-dependent oxidoreductase domain-containing protein n=1 Tax=Sinanodonta woodiana TaxID=1069815 RepID=A0ABD3T804_SINWO